MSRKKERNHTVSLFFETVEKLRFSDNLCLTCKHGVRNPIETFSL